MLRYLSADGSESSPLDLAKLQLLILIACRWLLERSGRRSVGRRCVALCVLDRPDRRPDDGRSLARRYLLFAVPVMPMCALAIVLPPLQHWFGPITQSWSATLGAFALIPLICALLVATRAIVGGQDAFYDLAAGTLVAQLENEAVRIVPDADLREPRRRPAAIAWLGRHKASFAAPILTVVIAATLVAVYIAEIVHARGIADPRGSLMGTEIAFGGMDGETVLQIGQWYRLLLSIGLHASAAHLIGNTVMLLAAGSLLEGVLGRGWLTATLLLGGLAGSLASVIVNPADMISVGASGAIASLVAAGLVVSLGLVPGQRRLWIQAFCLVCTLAVLESSGRFGTNTVDRADHFGGVAAGVVIGILILVVWKTGEVRPSAQRCATLVALGVSAALFVSGVRVGFGDPPVSALMVPIDQLPKSDPEWTARSDDLARRFPSDPRTHLARALAEGADPEIRDAELGKAVALHARLDAQHFPKNAQNDYVVIGLGRLEARDWRAAADLFTRAIAIDPPGTEEALKGRADAEEALGDLAGALGDERTRVAMQPNVADAHVDLADALFANGERQKAAAELDIAAALDPSSGLVARQRGWVTLFSDRPEPAVHELERASQLWPDDPYSALWLSIAQGRMRLENTLPALAHRLDLSVWPGPVVRFYLGEIGLEDLRSAAKDANFTKQLEQQCEAAFYEGERDIVRHEEDDGFASLLNAYRICPRHFFEWSAARAELEANRIDH